MTSMTSMIAVWKNYKRWHVTLDRIVSRFQFIVFSYLKSGSPIVFFFSPSSSSVLRLQPAVDGPRWSGIVARMTDEPLSSGCSVLSLVEPASWQTENCFHIFPFVAQVEQRLLATRASSNK